MNIAATAAAAIGENIQTKYGKARYGMAVKMYRTETCSVPSADVAESKTASNRLTKRLTVSSGPMRRTAKKPIARPIVALNAAMSKSENIEV
jgi:hypothetical protein